MRSRWINPGHDNTSVLTIHRSDESAGRLVLHSANAGLIYHRLLSDGANLRGDRPGRQPPDVKILPLLRPQVWCRLLGGQSSGNVLLYSSGGPRSYPAP